jgi:hypothetical protein
LVSCSLIFERGRTREAKEQEKWLTDGKMHMGAG